MKDILKKHKSKRGFTLAEVLITLVIIGVVTALTIPSLLANINDKTYDAKRQGFATRMAQAISQIGMLNTFEDSTNPTDNSSMNFIVEGLQKAYHITQVCEFENFKSCDFPAKINRLDNLVLTTVSYPNWSSLNAGINADLLGGYNTKAAVFRTKNGESALLYYNPKCVSEQLIEPDTIAELNMEAGTKNFAKEICVNMIYDLDGAKRGPNAIGRDIGFAIVLYPDTPYFVMTNGVFANMSPSDSMNADAECRNNKEGYGYAKGQWNLPSREELYVNTVTRNLRSELGFADGNYGNWSSTIEGASENDYGWVVPYDAPIAKLLPRSTAGYALCIVELGK